MQKAEQTWSTEIEAVVLLIIQISSTTILILISICSPIHHYNNYNNWNINVLKDVLIITNENNSAGIAETI